MGGRLRQILGERFPPCGFVFQSGGFRAVDMATREIVERPTENGLGATRPLSDLPSTIRQLAATPLTVAQSAAKLWGLWSVARRPGGCRIPADEEEEPYLPPSAFPRLAP
jgi:hypothetical protein